MEQLVALLPCSDANKQIKFYKHLGFDFVQKYVRSYLVFRYKGLALHFYGTKMYQPQENPSMCIIQTDNLQQLYNAFTSGLKEGMGKIPRSGFPKITKIRELSEDWRFTLTDPSGNTFYVIERKAEGSRTFFRDIDNEQYAGKFAILYDLIYSKEDLELANKVFSNLIGAKELLCDLEKAKLLLLQLEIYKGLHISYDGTELESLLRKYAGHNEWERIEQRWSELNPH